MGEKALHLRTGIFSFLTFVVESCFYGPQHTGTVPLTVEQEGMGLLVS